jgi:hypothetical protein
MVAVGSNGFPELVKIPSNPAQNCGDGDHPVTTDNGHRCQERSFSDRSLGLIPPRPSNWVLQPSEAPWWLVRHTRAAAIRKVRYPAPTLSSSTGEILPPAHCFPNQLRRCWSDTGKTESA